MSCYQKYGMPKVPNSNPAGKRVALKKAAKQQRIEEVYEMLCKPDTAEQLAGLSAHTLYWLLRAGSQGIKLQSFINKLADKECYHAIQGIMNGGADVTVAMDENADEDAAGPAEVPDDNAESDAEPEASNDKGKEPARARARSQRSNKGQAARRLIEDKN